MADRLIVTFGLVFVLLAEVRRSAAAVIKTGGGRGGAGAAALSAAESGLEAPAWSGDAEAAVLSWAWYPQYMGPQIFVNSLRMTGFKGQVLLGVHPNISAHDRAHFDLLNVTYRRVAAAPCQLPFAVPNHGPDMIRDVCLADFPHLKMESGRFAVWREMLNDCEKCTGWVLISDFSDVHFQRSPFTGLGEPEGQLLFPEEYLGKDESDRLPAGRGVDTSYWFTAAGVESCYGPSEAKRLGARPMLNIGTILGSRALVLGYLDRLGAEFEQNIKKGPSCDPTQIADQAVHNYLFYTGAFEGLGAKTQPLGRSAVMTVGFLCVPPKGSELDHSATDLLPTDGHGVVLNDDKTPSNLVHQAKVCWRNLQRPYIMSRFSKTASHVLAKAQNAIKGDQRNDVIRQYLKKVSPAVAARAQRIMAEQELRRAAGQW